jgi:ankyrin repeat protein
MYPTQKKSNMYNYKDGDTAAYYGYLEILQNNPSLHENQKRCTVKAMNWASGHGHLEIVKWLHENRSEGCTTNAMNSAAKNGHLEIVSFYMKIDQKGVLVMRWIRLLLMDS